MRGIHPDVKKLGAEIVAIGNGKPKHAAEFIETEKVPFPLLTDPSLETYRAADLASGIAKTLGPAALLRGLPALAKGFRQSRTKGHAFQQGGVFVLAKGGREVFAYRSTSAGDHPEIADVLLALRGISE